MSHADNPQLNQMIDESMVRNLRAQAEAIWPQERHLLESLTLPARARVLDDGCGTGEFVRRAATLWPGARLIGVDLIEGHLATARAACRAFADRVTFQPANAFALPFADRTFDLCVSRHVLQAVPGPARALAEMMRVTRPGGRLHVLAEDYGMIFMHPTKLGVEAFWHEAPARFGPALGTDLFVGRHMYTLLRRAGARDIRVDYVTVDTNRVPREVVASIWEAWRDGYAQGIAEHSRFTGDEVVAFFDDMIACTRDPDGYAVWHVPVFQAVVP